MAPATEEFLKPDQLSGQGLACPSPAYFGGKKPPVPITIWVDVDLEAQKPKPAGPRPADSGCRWTKRKLICALVGLVIVGAGVLGIALMASGVIDFDKIQRRLDQRGSE